MLEEPPPQPPKDISKRSANNKSGARTRSRPIEQPHVPCARQAEAAAPRKIAARAGTRRLERVTRSNYKAVSLIVKLRNIVKEEEEAGEKSKGGEDERSAPPLRKIRTDGSESNGFRCRRAHRSGRAFCESVVA